MGQHFCKLTELRQGFWPLNLTQVKMVWFLLFHMSEMEWIIFASETCFWIPWGPSVLNPGCTVESSGEDLKQNRAEVKPQDRPRDVYIIYMHTAALFVSMSSTLDLNLLHLRKWHSQVVQGRNLASTLDSSLSLPSTTKLLACVRCWVNVG